MFRFARRFAYGVIVYWALNAVLVLVECIWHPFAHLAAWDAEQVRQLAATLGGPK